MPQDGPPPRSGQLVERRQQERIPARVELHFRAAQDAAKALKAYSLNFSAGGLCIKSKKTYELGATLQITLDVAGQPLHVQGAVAWVRGGAIGIRFENVSPADRQRLQQLLAAIKSS